MTFNATRRRGALEAAEATTLARFLEQHPRPLLACRELSRHAFQGPRTVDTRDTAALIRICEEARNYIAENLPDGAHAAVTAAELVHDAVEHGAPERLRELAELLVCAATGINHPDDAAFALGAALLKDRGWLRVRDTSFWSLTPRFFAEIHTAGSQPAHINQPGAGAATTGDPRTREG